MSVTRALDGIADVLTKERSWPGQLLLMLGLPTLLFAVVLGIVAGLTVSLGSAAVWWTAFAGIVVLILGLGWGLHRYP
jgi:hypothetical protein